MNWLYLFCIFIFFLMLPTTLHAQQPQWYWATEFSPTSRMGNGQILQNTHSNLNLEWRNRVGMEIGNQLFLGLQGHIRKYENNEDYTHHYSFGAATGDFTYQVSNSLWGIGPFLTRIFEPGQKIKIHTTLFASREQGTGKYRSSQENFMCPVCEIAYVIDVEYPIEIDNIKFNERNFITGLELGATYPFTPGLSVIGNLNLIQYEDYKRSSAGGTEPEVLEPALNRNTLDSRSRFTHFFERPMVYLGILVAIR